MNFVAYLSVLLVGGGVVVYVSVILLGLFKMMRGGSEMREACRSRLLKIVFLPGSCFFFFRFFVSRYHRLGIKVDFII